MVALSIAYQDAVNGISALFDAEIQLDSQSLQNSKPYIFSEKDQEQIPQNLTEAKKLLLQSIDSETRVIKDIPALARVFDFANWYVREYWELHPETTKAELVKGARVLLNILPDQRGNIQFSKFSPVVHEFIKNPIHSTKRLLAIIQHFNDNRILLTLLSHKLYNFAISVQSLEERSHKTIQFQRKLAGYPDWNRAEQIQNNQAAINWMRARRQQEENMTQEEAKEAKREFEAFKEIIDSFRSPGNKLYTKE